MPKFAKAFPDALVPVALQHDKKSAKEDYKKIKTDKKVGDYTANAPITSEESHYSYSETILKPFLRALNYTALSKNSEVQKFHKSHCKDIAICVAALDATIQKEQMPDFGEANFPMDMKDLKSLEALLAIETVSELGIEKKELARWTDTLGQGTDQQWTKKARVYDLLSDGSMYEHILQAKDTDLPFIIGGKHFKKLRAPLGGRVRMMDDTTFCTKKEPKTRLQRLLATAPWT